MRSHTFELHSILMELKGQKGGRTNEQKDERKTKTALIQQQIKM